MDCAIRLFKEQGIRSVYKGTIITLIRGINRECLCFCLCVRSAWLMSGSLMICLLWVLQNNEFEKVIIKYFVAYQLKLLSDTDSKQACITRYLRDHRLVVSIYQPSLTLVSFIPPPDVPSNGLYFMTYEYVKCLLTPEGERLVLFWLSVLLSCYLISLMVYTVSVILMWFKCDHAKYYLQLHPDNIITKNEWKPV